VPTTLFIEMILSSWNMESTATDKLKGPKISKVSNLEKHGFWDKLKRKAWETKFTVDSKEMLYITDEKITDHVFA
jgi:hypothetical protein